MQIAAAQLLDENADDLATSAGYEFPVDPASAWEEDLSPLAREFLLSAFARMMIAKRFNEWHHESLNGFVSFLDSVRRRDDKTYIRDGALVCLDALLEVWDIEDYGIRLDDEYWDIDELRAKIRRLAADEEVLDNRVDVVLWQIIDTMRGDWAAEED